LSFFHQGLLDISIYDLCITLAGKIPELFFSPLGQMQFWPETIFREINYIAFGKPTGKAFPSARFIKVMIIS
jgi:hypothetical protein